MDQNRPPEPSRNEKVAAARISIVSNSVLIAAKLTVGLLTGSVSVVSEAAHSSSDLLASWIAFFSVRVSDLPADDDHPYGHGKVESLSGMAEALLIFAAAVYIIVEACHKISSGKLAMEAGPGMLVMGFSALVNIFVAKYLFRIARKTDSLALEADAEHLRTDVYTSVGVLVGLGLVKATGLHILDPIFAIMVALMIMGAAWRLTRDALQPLLDTQLPQNDIDAIRSVLDEEQQVLGYHKLRTRKSGSSRYVDAHVMMDDNQSLLAAHDLTEQLEDRMRAVLPNAEITLHTEPFRAEQRHQFEQHGGPDPDDGEYVKPAVPPSDTP